MKKADERIKESRKSSQAEMELRVRVICEMLITGNNREDIVQYSSLNWGIGLRQVAKYLKMAKERIAKSVQKEIEFDYAKAIRRYEELYKLSIGRSDYRTAMSINKELASLQGLYKQQIEHSGSVDFICNIPE